MNLGGMEAIAQQVAGKAILDHAKETELKLVSFSQQSTHISHRRANSQKGVILYCLDRCTVGCKFFTCPLLDRRFRFWAPEGRPAKSKSSRRVLVLLAKSADLYEAPRVQHRKAKCHTAL